MESNSKKIQSEISTLIDKELEENTALLGINFGTSGGTFILSKFKEKLTDLNDLEITAASSSLLFISRNMLKGSLNQDISYNLIAGKKIILISIMSDDISMVAYLDRELAELEGIDNIIRNLKAFTIKVIAIIVTSEIIKEEIFVAIKRAIPNALVIAIITKEGLPIKIQATMPESTISAMISALYNLSDILIGGMEFSIIAGENGSIIIHELDESRILCVAVPEADESKLGTYIVRIKGIIESEI